MDEKEILKLTGVSWQKKMIIPGTNWEIQGSSTAAFFTGFLIPSLGIGLDAGNIFYKRPDHIFITHTHLDHIRSLPQSMMGLRGVKHLYNIYAPSLAVKNLEDFVITSFRTNSLSDKDYSERWKIHGCSKGDLFPLKIKEGNVPIVAEIFECDHYVPTISYGLSEVRKKLKNEYSKLSGNEIRNLRENGIQITEEVNFKKFCFVCDSSIQVFEMNPSILEYPVIFIECTFIFEDELENAHRTKHIHWSQLKPYVENFPSTIFVMFHFSNRYELKEIDDFFTNENMKNLKWWI